MSTVANRQPVGLASLWMLGSLASFLTMAIAGRELSAAGMTTFQILLVRSLVGLVVVSALLTHYGWGQVTLRRMRLHVIRNLCHFGGQYGWFYGIAMIPLAEVFAIEFTTPVWTAIIATILLKEKLTPPRLAAIVLGLTGAVLILRPGMAVVHPAAFVVLAAAGCFAMSYVLTRRLASTESALAIIFYMTVIQLPLAIGPAAANWVTPTLASLPPMLVVGGTALSAHYCLARALTLADATVVVPMDFLRLPLAGVFGFLLYGEQLDWLVLGGAVLMLAGNLGNIYFERRRLAH